MGPYAVNLSGPHSIPVSWEPVPEGFVHGILLGYRILYRVLSIAGDDVKRLTLNTTTTETPLNTTLTRLLNYAVYDIRVLAFTVKGDGAASQNIIAGMFTDYKIITLGVQLRRRRNVIFSRDPVNLLL